MNEQKRAERRLNLIEERLDKISETLILLCEISTQTNVSDTKQKNQLSTLKRHASNLSSLQRKS